MIRELDLISELASNPFLEEVEVSEIFKKISKKINVTNDSLELRSEFSGQDLFADVQADGMQ